MPNFKCITCSVLFIHIIFLMSSVCLILCESSSSFSWLDIISVIKLFLTLGLAKIDGCVWSEAKCPVFNEALSNLMFLISGAEDIDRDKKKKEIIPRTCSNHYFILMSFIHSFRCLFKQQGIFCTWKPRTRLWQNRFLSRRQRKDLVPFHMGGMERGRD